MNIRSNAQRKSDNDANLERKRDWLAELVLMVADGESLSGISYPTTMEEFRQFEESERGLRRVGSPKTLSKKSFPERTAIIDEIDGLLSTLRAYRAGARKPVKKASLSSQVEKLKVERDSLKYLVGRLLSQVASLLDSNHKLRMSAQAADESRKRMSETVRALNKNVVQLGGSLARGVKRDD